MIELNDRHDRIQVTGNFVIGNELPDGHVASLKALLQDARIHRGNKGAVYLSPLKDSPKKRELLPSIKEIKKHSSIPIHTYLIQRL